MMLKLRHDAPWEGNDPEASARLRRAGKYSLGPLEEELDGHAPSGEGSRSGHLGEEE
jgi:hypothetical protein